MNEHMSEFIIPRDEKELCGFFEDFLFMNTEKFPGFREEKGDDRFKLNEKDLQLLHKTGVVRRIFRRWFQTTWGDKDWSNFFSGETPRQELSHYYSDIQTGNAMVSVEMNQVNKKWSITPYITFKKDIAKDGMFTYGLENVQQQNFAPSFDFGFKEFSKFMLKAENIARGLKSYSPAENEEERWWKLFWSQVGVSLVFNIKLELPEKQLFKLAFELQSCMNYFANEQSKDRDGFIEIDTMIEHFWHILRSVDDRLDSYSEMTNKNKDNISSRIYETNYLYSVKVFYHLGHMLDEKILFPADIYFGGVECVWTDKLHFMETMMNTIMLLKNNLSTIDDGLQLNEQEKEQMNYIGLANTVMNIEKTWFAPSTAFRLLPSVKRYF